MNQSPKINHLQRKRIILATLVFFIFSHSITEAQSQFSGWLATFNTFKTGKKTSIHNDIQWRSSDEWKHTQTFLFRTGLNIHLNKTFTITGGYAFIHNRRVISGVAGYLPEHRIWEQLLINHKINSVFTSHRFRLEQRFIAKTQIVNNQLEKDGSAYANRFRYFIRNLLPLKKEASFKKGLFAALQNEVFVNFGNTSTVNGKFFDQNRLYMAIGYRLKPEFDLEAGYMNQYLSGAGSAFTNNHIVQLAGYLRL